MGQTLPDFLIVLGGVKVEPRKREILKAWEWFYINTRLIEAGVVRALAGVCIMQIMDGGKQCPGCGSKLSH